MTLKKCILSRLLCLHLKSSLIMVQLAQTILCVAQNMHCTYTELYTMPAKCWLSIYVSFVQPRKSAQRCRDFKTHLTNQYKKKGRYKQMQLRISSLLFCLVLTFFLYFFKISLIYYILTAISPLSPPLDSHHHLSSL